MKLSKPLFFSLIFLLTTGILGGVQASAGYNDRKKNGINGFRPTKLFVFGDSYADTGNNRQKYAGSWKHPYGITFPGKPSGRFSDGRVLTDFIARFLGVKSPTPYRWMTYARQRLNYGMNFAFGGTGVFDTIFPAPNMTAQIDFFQKLIEDSVYSKNGIESSMALVTLAGNDYGTYLIKDGSDKGLAAFISVVVNQLAANMKRIHGLGAKKVSVTSLEPLGCLPRATLSSSFQKCNDTQNLGVILHNSLLQKAVAQLNNETNGSPYSILDIYGSFISVLNPKKLRLESRVFETPLKPCCMGVSLEYHCSDVARNGTKLYTMCSDPNTAFFWDGVHPTQAGWRAVYNALKLAYGAGMIDPTAATNSGLVFDINEVAYVSFLCKIGYKSSYLRKITGNITNDCSRTSDANGEDGLNYPTINLNFKKVSNNNNSKIVGVFHRTATNVGKGPAVYM